MITTLKFRSRRAALAAICIGLGRLGPAPAGAAEDPVPRIDEWITGGNHSQALAEVRRLRGALPPGQRLTAWEHDFEGVVSRVAYGKHHLYYQLSASALRNTASGRENPLKTISVNHSSSDWSFLIVCLALETGEIRWSRGVNGLVHFDVDPETDRLLLYREKLMIVDPGKGDILEQDDLPDGGRAIRGLSIGSRLALSRPHSADRIAPDSRIRVYSSALKSAREIAVADYWFLAPDESMRLVPKSDGLEGRGLPEGNVLWSVPYRIDRYPEPLWVGSNPVFVAGSESTRGTVASLDARSGRILWETPLGFGTYESTQHQLRGGEYPDNFRPLTALDSHLLALDGSGQLVLLDPETGRVAATARLHRDYLGMPAQRGGQLIVTSFEGVRSFALESLVHPDASVDAALQVRESRCLRALRQGREALAVLDRLLERAPRFESGWTERGIVCQSLGEVEDTSFSQTQALALSGRSTSAELRMSDGLLRLYDLGGRPGWSLVESSGRVYAGTLGGALWSVRADNLEPGSVTNLKHEITAFESVTELRAALSASGLQSPVPAAPDERDPEIPDDWWTSGGGIGPVVAYQGRQFRALAGGGVRILNHHEMEDLPAVLDDVTEWAIHVSPNGPLGYGEGVFELDCGLRPVRWLIRPTVAGKKPERVSIEFLAETAETIGLVVGGSDGAALQVYSRDGQLIREALLGRFISGWARPDQFIPLGNGYLFSDRQLVWVGAGPAQHVWRFGPALSRTETDRWGDRWRYFGVPLLANGSLYVTGLHGQLFIFATPPPSARAPLQGRE